MNGGRSEELEDRQADELGARYVAGETVVLRLPAKAEYVPVLRAVVGVVAGTLSFSYDEIVSLRVAVSEAFGLVMRHMPQGDPKRDSVGVRASFFIGNGELEIVLASTGSGYVDAESAGDVESQAVLESLVDAVSIGAVRSGERGISLVKYRSS